MAIASTLPEFVCDECGAAAIEIPEWTDDQTVLSCQDCGKPIGAIGHLLELLQEASVDNENLPSDDEQNAAAQLPSRILS